jgi:hypothetical protein
MQKMKTKFEDKNNKKKRYNQKAIVEENFGHIFYNIRFIDFQTRTIKKNQTETNILSFALTML